MFTKIIKQDINDILKNKQINWELYRGSTVLITGSTGMLGQYITLTFLYLQKIYNIKLILLVRDVEKCKKLFKSFLNRDVKIMFSNFEYLPTINEESIDYIIHAASLASPVFYETVPVDVIIPNTIGLYKLLKLAREKKTKKFLFMSSSEVYGLVNSQNNYSENDLGIVDCAEIRNCYAESKRMGENLCVSFTKQYGIDTNCVRIYHTYGPTMNIYKDKRAFCEFTKNVVESKNIEIKGDGKAMRPFLYITDAIVAFFIIIQDGKMGEVYNMSNENNYVSIWSLANTLVELYPQKNLKIEKTIRDSSDSYSEKRDENQVTGSSKKLMKLGWVPKVNIEDGFKRTIDSKIEELIIKEESHR